MPECKRSKDVSMSFPQAYPSHDKVTFSSSISSAGYRTVCTPTWFHWFLVSHVAQAQFHHSCFDSKHVLSSVQSWLVSHCRSHWFGGRHSLTEQPTKTCVEVHRHKQKAVDLTSTCVKHQRLFCATAMHPNENTSGSSRTSHGPRDEHCHEQW